jgi:uncharacterized membrane protein YqjE
MADAPPKSGGVVSRFRHVLRTALEAAHNRVELFALELREERLRLLTLLAWTGGVMFLALLAAGTITVAVILLFDEAFRPWAAGVLGLLYLAGAFAGYRGLRGWMQRQPAPFAETLDQLRKDEQWLKSLQQKL